LDLHAAGAPNYTWFGTGVNGNTDSTVTISFSGLYGVGSVVYDTNSFGCTATYSTSTQILIEDKPQPVVTPASNVICPGDSVLLVSSSFTGNAWEGPNGPIADSGNAIYVSDPGYYYTVVNDSDSCGLVSAAILLTQYTTPSVAALGDTGLCDGDSIIISVQAGSNSIIEWQAPLSGDSTSQVIYSPGTYTVKITSCGIETFASITIYSSQALSTITPGGVLCEDSTVVLSAPSGMASYLWFPGGQTTQNITISTPGNYVLAVQDSSGCTSVSDTLTIEEIVVPSDILATAYGFCYGDSLTLSGAPGLAGYLWLPTGDTTPSIVTYQPGFFTLIVTDTNGCVAQSDATEIVVPDTVATLDLSGPIYFCEGETLVLDAETSISANYLWFPGGETTPTIEVTQSGVFAVAVVDTFGCNSFSDTISVKVDPNTLITPIVSNDTTVCLGTSALLKAEADSGIIVWYSDLSGVPLFTGAVYEAQILTPTTFYVRTESAVCESDPASVFVDIFDCDNVKTGNIFTPNGDGVNDNFRVQIFGATYFRVEIFNRWGGLIYFFDHPNQSWDGTMYETGEALPDGTYYYVVNYRKYDGTDVTEKGYVTLMR
jgi:gliding motility-associated-like protein